ncbi:hypothetical protein EWB00_001651, partial [Schistosoma japonicum]
MRIINLVNISTVLLLINLIQTKSQGHGNQYGSELKVKITTQLEDIRENDLVKWNPIYQDDSTPEYHELSQFLPFVKKNVYSNEDDGKCVDVTFTPTDNEAKVGSNPAVNVKLTLTFKDPVAINQNAVELDRKLSEIYETFKSQSYFKANKAKFDEYDIQIVIFIFITSAYNLTT